MNFDEASELFSDETLESMQMAKVNGGGFWVVVGAVAAVITIVSAGVAVCRYILKDGTTSGPEQNNIEMRGKDIFINGSKLVGFGIDTVGTNVVYKYTFPIESATTPTPTQTLSWYPPMS